MDAGKLKYDNYVFDLYGTLIDIRTDEEDLRAWEKLALLFRYHGADYEAAELRGAYKAAVNRALDDSWAKYTGGPRPKLASERASSRLNGETAAKALAGAPVIDTAEIRIEDVFCGLYEAKGVRPGEALVQWTCQMFRIVTTVSIRLFPEVKERLTELRNRGARLYLLTNAQRAFTAYELHMFGLEDYFDGILMSSDKYYKKPDRRFYESLIEIYGLDPARSLMSGDDAVCDVAGACSAGMAGFLVRHEKKMKDGEER